MNDFQLFCVTVTQTWSAEADALVLAGSKEQAERAARREVEFDFCDAEEVDTITWAKPVPIETVNAITKDQAADLWLLIPDPKNRSRWDAVTLDEFRQAFTPEELERARIAVIERDNGQLPLLEPVA